MLGPKFIKFFWSVLKWQYNSLCSYFFYFGLKDLIKIPILRLSGALVKIRYIPHVIFHTKSHPSVSWKITPPCFLGQTLNTLHNRSKSKCKFCQILPNSCYFWNKRSVFLQTLHQSSRSWDITPLNFLAKILYTLRSLPKHKFGEIWCEQLKVWNFALWWAPFVQIMYNFSYVWKMTWEIWWVLTWAVKNLKICTLMGYFCQKYLTFELK